MQTSIICQATRMIQQSAKLSASARVTDRHSVSTTLAVNSETDVARSAIVEHKQLIDAARTTSHVAERH